MTSDLLGGPLGQAIGLALLHALWQGAIVAGLLAATLTLLGRRSASLRYAIACAALLIVFVLAVITGIRSYTPQHESASVAATITAPPVLDDAVLIAATATPVSWHDRWLDAVEAVRAHIPQIVVLWFAGVLILTLRLAASWTRMRALATRGAVAAGEAWQGTARRLSLALGLRTAVRLVVSGGVEVPSVVGWLQPAILLPVSSFTGLTAEQLEMVLAHELAHIRRHDFLINAMQSVIETLLFYHPAVWYLSRQIRIERENCCDDLAVSICGDAILYARALAQLEELRATPAMAIAANGGSLIERVRRLVGARSDRSLFSSGWTAAAAMASFIALLALTTAPMLAERVQTPPPPPQPAGAKVVVKAPAPPPTPEEVESAGDAMDVDVETPEPPEPPEVVVAPAPAIDRVVSHRVRVARVAPLPGVATYIDVPDDETPSTTPPGKLSVDELISLRVQGVTPEYIQQMRSIGFGDLPLRDIISFKVQDVTAGYIEKMRGAGLGELTAHDIVSLKVQSVTPDYVSAMRAAGVNVKTARDAVSLKVQNVTPDFVRQLAAAGYDKLTVRDLVRLAVSGVNADFIREMSKYKTRENNK